MSHMHNSMLCGIRDWESAGCYSNKLSSCSWLQYIKPSTREGRGSKQWNWLFYWNEILQTAGPARHMMCTIFTGLIDINIPCSGSCITFRFPGFPVRLPQRISWHAPFNITDCSPSNILLIMHYWLKEQKFKYRNTSFLSLKVAAIVGCRTCLWALRSPPNHM